MLGIGKRFPLLSLNNTRHLITDADLTAGAARHHRHGKRRVLLAEFLDQGSENRQIPFTCRWIRMRGEAPGFRFDHVKFHSTYVNLSTDPALLFPGS